MKVGGQILWNVTPICETFKISCLMGRLHTKDVLENQLKDQSFRLVHWLSNILFLRKTSRKKVLPGLFLGFALYAGGMWKGDTMVASIEELETMDASEIYSKKKRLNAKERILPQKKKWKIQNSSRRWTNQTFLEEIRN